VCEGTCSHNANNVGHGMCLWSFRHSCCLWVSVCIVHMLFGSFSRLFIHTPCVKKPSHHVLVHIFAKKLTYFQNLFTIALCRKFAIVIVRARGPHLKCITTFEIYMVVVISGTRRTMPPPPEVTDVQVIKVLNVVIIIKERGFIAGLNRL